MLKNEEWEIVNEIAAALYENKSTESMRKAFLSRLMTLISFDLADFALAAEPDAEGLCLGEPVVVSRCFDKSREKAFAELYGLRYYKLDYVSWIFSHPRSVVYREADLIDKDLRKESQFYKEYLQKYDLGSVVGISIIKGGRLLGALTLYKSESRGDFSARDLYILKQLEPHLQNTLSMGNAPAEKDRGEARRILKYRYGITKKEMDIIAGIVQGRSNAEIASDSGTSENTVKSHIANIFGKTSVKSRTQLIRFLMEQGLLNAGE